MGRFLSSFFEKSNVSSAKPDIPTSFRVKFFLSFLSLMGLVTATAYRGKLVGILAFPWYQDLPQNFKELADSKYNVTLHHYGGVGYDIIRFSTDPSMQEINRRMKLEPSAHKCFMQARNDKNSCIDWGGIVEFSILKEFSDQFGRSDLIMSPSGEIFHLVGISLRKRSQYMDTFRWAVGRVVDGGLPARWDKMDFDSVRRDVRQSRIDDPGAFYQEEQGLDMLTLKNFKGAFLVLFTGVAGGCSIFFGEVVSPLLNLWRLLCYILNFYWKLTSSVGRVQMKSGFLAIRARAFPFLK